jgi:isoquinoline 1-oxidoreductase alpha subunit
MRLTINGRALEASVPPNEALLWVLRDDLGLTGTKPGCGSGVCGLCTVLVDGRPVHSCRTLVRDVAGQEIRTVEGLAGSDADGREALHPVQRAFLELQVPQCGWCTPGQLVTAAAFLDEHPDPSDEEIVSALDGVLCRCGSYPRVVGAVRRALELQSEAGGAS